MELIDKYSLVGKYGLFSKRGCYGRCDRCKLWSAEGCRVILEAPTVDATLVVHGHWKFLNDYQSRCSECYEVSWVDHDNEPSYCPNCGSKMDGGN